MAYVLKPFRIVRFGELVALVGLTALAAGHVPIRSVHLEFRSLHGRWHLRHWEPATPDEPWTMRLGGPRVTPANTRLSLPLELLAPPLRLSLRAFIDVRSDWIVHACQTPLGRIQLPAGAWGEFGLESANARTSCPLAIGLALAPRPLVRGSPSEKPKLLVEGLRLEAPGGLRLTALARLVVAVLPASAILVTLLLGLRRGGAVTLTMVTAAASLFWTWWSPLAMLFAAPLVAALALIAAGSVRFHPARLLGKWFSRPSRLLDRLLMGTAQTAGTDRLPPAPWVRVVPIALTPALAISGLLGAFFGKTVFDHVPGSINDAIDYWLETAAFAHAGLGGGYFSFDERPAPAAFFRFGVHGPVFPMLYGGLGRLGGWRAYSAPLFHVLLLTAALVYYLRTCRLDLRQSVLATLWLASFWPLILFLPTNMQEGLHLALALAFAAVLHEALQGRLPTQATRAIAFCLLTLAILLRPSWGVVLPVLLLYCGPRVLRQHKVLGIAVASVLLLGLLFVFSYSAAPMAGKPFLFLRAASLQEPFRDLLDHAWTNVKRMLFGGTPLERQERFLVIGLASLCGVLATLKHRRAATWFHAYNLGAMLFAVVATYGASGWGDFRVLGAHLFLSVALLIASPEPLARRLALLVIAGHLAATGAFLQAFGSLGREPYTFDHQRIADFARLARKTVPFRPGDDPWCNTLVTAQYPFFFPEMVGLAPGLGVTMLFPPPWGHEGPRPSLKSQYVLLNLEKPLYGGTTIVVERRAAQDVDLRFGDWMTVKLRLLAETPIGSLYRNLEAHCPAA